MVFWLPLRRSRWLKCLHRLQIGCAVLALWHIECPITIRLLALGLIALSSKCQSPLPQALFFDTKGIQLIYSDRRESVRLGAQCHCNEYLVVLNFKLTPDVLKPELEGKGRSSTRRLLLLPDSSNPEALRKLRVYLRWHAQM